MTGQKFLLARGSCFRGRIQGSAVVTLAAFVIVLSIFVVVIVTTNNHNPDLELC